ncbi:MAG: UvrD-helicase domain-containing protein [Bryobacteraceae bacterium]
MSGAAVARLDDAAARERIRHSLHESLIVEAAAGTGKTTELVRRIVAVLEQGLTTVDKIVAVTFTHKAAGELKLRLRQGLDRTRTGCRDPQRLRNLEDALARLEEASIGTIHAFCAQILRERPVEARVDPSFQELSELEAQRLFDRAFRGWIQGKLNEDAPALRRALSRLAWRDTRDDLPPIGQLQYAARTLIEWRDFPEPWARLPFDRAAQVDVLVERVRDASQRMNQAFRPVHEAAQWIERAEAVDARDYDTLESIFVRLERDLRNLKRKGAEALLAELEAFRFQADADLASQLRGEMWDLVERYEQYKRRSGQLDFLDLLMLARDLVRENGEVRHYLQNRFTHIFVDEFQDTDPLQAELLLLLAADNPEVNNWLETQPAAGKLFVVGDPKQSIYKFRRADVVLYQMVKDRLERQGVGVVYLSKSFRSVRTIQQCVNAAFEPEMSGPVDGMQAQYVPLEEHVPAPVSQPSLIALPAPRPYATRYVAKSAINACLPDTVVGLIEWLLGQSGWTVRDPEHPKQRIPIQSRHICVLFRRFTNYGQDLTRDYTRGLEARGIPHLLVGSKSFHAREEVETMRAALTAVEWPSDELSVFATLRGSLFALADNTLLKFRHKYGKLHPFHEVPEGQDAEFEPVREALLLLADLHRNRNRRAVAETVNRLLEATRAFAGFALRPAGRQVLANVYRIADLARTYEIEGGISFRGFVEMLEAQAEKGESSEAPIVEEGSEGVRLMTVHAAKGLEFPVVILGDMTANLAAREPDRYVDAEKRLCASRLLWCSPWELVANREEEMKRERAEGIRVAYVAATRARDLLVIPTVGDEEMDGWLQPLNKALYPPRDKQRKSKPAAGCPEFGSTSVLQRPPDLFAHEDFSVRPGLHKPQQGEHDVVWWDPAALRLNVEAGQGLRHEEILAEGSAASLDRYREWSQARADRISESSRPLHTVFTPSEAREAPPDFDCEIGFETVSRPDTRPGGRRFGTLVHAAMRDVPFDAEGPDVVAVVQLHARLLGAGDADVSAAADAVIAALRHPLIRAAHTAEECLREVPVTYKFDGRIVEGVIDLAYRAGGAWMIVDFKTDEDLDANRKHYEMQLRWYAFALSRVTGAVARGWLLGV